ncbi:MAG: alpha/beta hydrolase fold domain-containing protein, partial [Dehalococcoidia bacterium]
MDEQLRRAIDYFIKPPPDPLPDISIEDRRRIWEAGVAAFNAGAPDRPVERGVFLRERDGHRLTVDVYPADGPGPHPLLFYIHGGAWSLGNPAGRHKFTCRMAEAGYVTLSVDYALAPEHPFPAGFDDCLYAAGWVLEHAADYDGDARRVAVCGDSSGANLAAAVLHAQIDANGGTPFTAASLIYGVYDFPLLLRIPVGSPFTNYKGAGRMMRDYLGERARDDALRDPRLSPI